MGKKKGQKRATQAVSGTSVEKALVENFISLQRVMVNLSSKFDNLANEISKLLELFEISAKALAEKNFSISGDKNSEKVIQKIDTLLDQNKTIARGLTLMHELNSKPFGYPAQPALPPQRMPGPAPIAPSAEGYQKSIASDESSGSESEIPAPSKERKFRKLPGSG